MMTRRWTFGSLVLLIGSLAAGCDDDSQEIIDALCARWDQCNPDQLYSGCFFSDHLDDCENADELVDHFEGCLDMSCDQLTMDCIISMPNCDRVSPPSSGWLPWLPGEDVEEPMPLPGPGSPQ